MGLVEGDFVFFFFFSQKNIRLGTMRKQKRYMKLSNLLFALQDNKSCDYLPLFVFLRGTMLVLTR